MGVFPISDSLIMAIPNATNSENPFPDLMPCSHIDNTHLCFEERDSIVQLIFNFLSACLSGLIRAAAATILKLML